MVQEAYLRAFRFFAGFHGEDGRAWLLGIVRNTSYTWMQQNRSAQLNTPLDDELPEVKTDDMNPEALLLQKTDAQMLRQAVEELPLEFREVLVPRELDEMSYKQLGHELLGHIRSERCGVARICAVGAGSAIGGSVVPIRGACSRA